MNRRMKTTTPADEVEKGLGVSGMIELTSVEQLMILSEMAHETHEDFLTEIKPQITPIRAVRIRSYRVKKGYTWRAVAEKTYQDWGSDHCWEPSSNQLAGMALCEHAADLLGEDYMKKPWN